MLFQLLIADGFFRAWDWVQWPERLWLHHVSRVILRFLFKPLVNIRNAHSSRTKKRRKIVPIAKSPVHDLECFLIFIYNVTYLDTSREKEDVDIFSLRTYSLKLLHGSFEYYFDILNLCSFPLRGFVFPLSLYLSCSFSDLERPGWW